MYKRQAQKETAYPSTFVINKNGEIVYSKTSTTHGGRADNCLLYTSDAADERSSVDLGGRRIIKKKSEDTDGGRTLVKQKSKQK